MRTTRSSRQAGREDEGLVADDKMGANKSLTALTDSAETNEILRKLRC